MKQIVKQGSKNFYHIHNRGRLDRDIYIDHRDYFRFTLLLYVCNNDRPVSSRAARCVGANYYGLGDIKRGKPLVDIVSHSLMPNRFHLLLRERKSGNLSKFMSKLSTGYSMYFNKKYSREGSVFAGPFRSTKVETDAYMKYLFAYIHLKPLKHKALRKKSEPKYLGDEKVRDSLRRYEYSSYLDYVENNRKRKVILDTDTFYKFFQTPKDFEQNIFDWLRFEKTADLQDHPEFFKQQATGSSLGKAGRQSVID